MWYIKPNYYPSGSIECFEVGHYDPKGEWVMLCRLNSYDFHKPAEACEVAVNMVCRLNGGK